MELIKGLLLILAKVVLLMVCLLACLVLGIYMFGNDQIKVSIFIIIASIPISIILDLFFLRWE